jgi:tryptophan 2,3-dioxygenase
MPLLARTLQDAFYPELWEVRNRLTDLANQQGLR